MATQITYRDPNDGLLKTVGANMLPTLAIRYNGKGGFGDLDEPYLTLSGSKTNATGQSEQLTVSYPALNEYYMCVNGGDYIPHPKLGGQETFLAADIADDAVSMTVMKAETVWKQTAQDIFVPDRPYLLMNRKPSPGEDIFKTGVEDGLLAPAAEIIFIGSAYAGGVTVPIVRGTGALARKRMAVIQALTGNWASRADDSESAGLLVEKERPDAVTLGVATSPSAGTIKAFFIKSTQQADTVRSNGGYGVVTHYGIWVLPKAGLFKYNVRGLPENAAPAQYGSAVNAVVGIDNVALVAEEVEGTSYLTLTGINRAWNPETCALGALSAGWYWVGVRAMNQAGFDGNLRASKIVFTAVQVS